MTFRGWVLIERQRKWCVCFKNNSHGRLEIILKHSKTNIRTYKKLKYSHSNDNFRDIKAQILGQKEGEAGAPQRPLKEISSLVSFACVKKFEGYLVGPSGQHFYSILF